MEDDNGAIAKAMIHAIESAVNFAPFGGCRRKVTTPVRNAFLSTPRHWFLHKFIVPGQREVVDADRDGPENFLDLIYGNNVLVHVGPRGEELLSTNSEPFLVVYMLGLLDLQEGQNVLEVGSGGGWVTAMLGRLVGEGGKVEGIEVIGSLACRSEADVRNAGLVNVRIRCGDASEGVPVGATYDRILFTAAIWKMPDWILAGVRDDGLVLAPIGNPGAGDELHLLRRCGRELKSEFCCHCAFVPLVGARGGEATGWYATEQVNSLRAAWNSPAFEREIVAGASRIADWRQFYFQTYELRSFLSKTESKFFSFGDNTHRGWHGGSDFGFGLMEEDGSGVAVCERGVVRGYGNTGAAERLSRAVERWRDLGRPRGTDFGLTVRLREDRKENSSGRREQHGEYGWRARVGRFTYVWSL